MNDRPKCNVVECRRPAKLMTYSKKGHHYYAVCGKHLKELQKEQVANDKDFTI